ncbi:helix-turn-helix domain-containing protein [Rhodococcus hoagii]|nr:helix-turn-helix domain-containing protein [Prescottella equi]
MTLQTRRARESGGLGVTQLAEILDMDKSQVSRSLKVLTEYGMVDRDPKTRAFRLDGESSTCAGQRRPATAGMRGRRPRRTAQPPGRIGLPLGAFRLRRADLGRADGQSFDSGDAGALVAVLDFGGTRPPHRQNLRRDPRDVLRAEATQRSGGRRGLRRRPRGGRHPSARGRAFHRRGRVRGGTRGRRRTRARLSRRSRRLARGLGADVPWSRRSNARSPI